MSYRICAECDCVINNTVHHKDECPRCNSLEMCDPVTDTRDWDKLYEIQKSINLYDPPHKYKVGTKWVMTNPQTNEQFVGEVLALNDKRINKFKTATDVCLYFDELKWGTTYDAEFLDDCCTPV